MTLQPLDGLRSSLESVAEPDSAPAMVAYMKDQFDFLGIRAADRRTASKPWLTAAKTADATELLSFVHDLWSQPEREFQYVGIDMTRAGARNLGPDDLDAVRELVETKSWWDTVDSLAAWTVGPMVRRHRELIADMDDWIDDPNLWIARTALLHQLGYKADTDAARLFRYCDIQAEHPDFFIRKAIGWALRQYARVDPDAVGLWVEENRHRLAGLTVREATKHL